MRVVIDTDACCGNGRCYSLLPQLFTDDERGYGEVIGTGELDGADQDAAERAIRACPEDAITLVP